MTLIIVFFIKRVLRWVINRFSTISFFYFEIQFFYTSYFEIISLALFCYSDKFTSSLYSTYKKSSTHPINSQSFLLIYQYTMQNFILFTPYFYMLPSKSLLFLALYKSYVLLQFEHARILYLPLQNHTTHPTNDNTYY